MSELSDLSSQGINYDSDHILLQQFIRNSAKWINLPETRLALLFFKFIVKLLCSYENSCTKILPRIYISSPVFNCIDKI